MSRHVRGVFSTADWENNININWHPLGRIQQARDETRRITSNPRSSGRFADLILNNEYEVLDFGGGAGIDYFTFFTLKGEPKSYWTVFEVPNDVPVYAKSFLDFPKLKHVPTTRNLVGQTNCEKVMYSRGCLQYVENPLGLLKDNLDKFKVIYLRDLIVGNDNFITEQVGIGKINVMKKEDLLAVFKDFEIEVEETAQQYNTLEYLGDKVIYPMIDILAIRK